jgi:8-oxo-dGTP diphosphatase
VNQPQPLHPAPIVSVDIVLLALVQGQLCAALTLRDNEPFAGRWALPGGYVHVDEDQTDEAAAARILRAKTGLRSPYLEQLRTFAGADRDPRGWSVSIAHYALVPLDSLGKALPDKVKWAPVDELQSMPFDHLTILRTAVERVRDKSLYSSLPVHLMPDEFTLTQLQQVYETLLGASLDKRAFRRRMEELNILEEVKGWVSVGAHRPAQLYRIKRRAKKTLKTADSNLGLKA